MVVAIDLGNTYIHIGLYRGENLTGFAKMPHAGKINKITIEKFFAKLGLWENSKIIEGAAIASVVPVLTSKLTEYFKEKFIVSPIIVSSAVDCRLKFGYYKPKTLGPDRIANAVGGLARYKSNLIIIDFGTATTFDVVLKDNNYLGGMIIPGIETGLWALTEKTALLSKMPFKKPSRVIGRSTKECLQSGIFNGTVVMVQGLIHKIKKEIKKKFLCIATGGWGNVMASQIPEIDHFDPDLCLFGVLKIYYYNV